MESEDADSLDASSSTVLEYYRKFSRDKKLATYFCGDVTINELEHEKNVRSPVENLPGITVTDVTDCEVERAIIEEHINKSRPPLIGQDKYDNVGMDDSENEIVRASSPSSSVASNRKLEWDSGADIGYENCHKQKFLHKSLSLPSLMSGDKIDLNKTLLRLSPEGKVTENSTQTQQKESSTESSDAQIKPSEIPLTSSSSESGQHPAQVIQSSSSSSYISKLQDLVSSTESECDSEVKNNVLDFLRKKVGLPAAASTPAYKLKEINLTILPSVSVSPKVKSESDSGQECVGSTTINSNLTYFSRKTFTSVISVVDNLKQINNGFDIISSHIPNSSVKKPNHFDLLDQRKTNSLIYRNKKLKQLHISTPLVVECLESLVYGKKALDKVIQTTPISYISIGIQTEAENHSISEDICMKNQADRQSIIYFYHSDSDREPSSRTLGTNTLSNATDQDISNCNSFEYVYGDQHDVNPKQDASKLDVNQISPLVNAPDDIVKVNAGANNLKRSQARSDLNVVSPDSVNRMSTTSHINPLGDLIAHEQSKNSEVDISKNIDLIKKLIKSKKYDKITKQYYIKKIVQTILNSNENSDSSDATSDVDKNKLITGKQVNSVSNKPEEYVESLPCRSKQQRNLQENLPWMPAPLSSKQLEIRTFSTEILPETALIISDASKLHSKSSQVKKNSVFTLPSDPKYYSTQSSSDRSSTNEVNPNFQQPAPAQLSTDTSEQDSDYVNKNSFRNWKETKTLSEERFELQQALESSKKNCGDVESTSHSESDMLLNFAKKERDNQINWINNEIVHLSKLKYLLQKKDYKVNVDVLTKPEISNMNNMKKSTSVYVITTEKPGSPKNGRKPVSSNESTSSRKETINVKVTSHKHEPIWFKNGERYGRNATYNNNTYPPIHCKCAKSKANNQICTDETCAYSTTSQLRKSSPQRTKESSQKESRPSRLCKCTDSKINNQVCSDETCLLHLTKKTSPQRTKEIPRQEIRPSTSCKCSKSKIKDQICTDETCPHLTASRLRKSSPRRTAEDLQKELRKRSEKLNDDARITHLTLNSGLKQAKLISGELYSNGLHPYACIRRYVFEIPLSPVVLDKNTPEEVELKHAKDKLTDEYAAQHVMIEEKMSFPDKRNHNENTVVDEFIHRGEVHHRIRDIDDEKIQHRPYYVDSYALTEIHGDQSKYLTEKDIADRKLENTALSSGSYVLTEIYRDNDKKDLDKQDTHRSNAASQTSILDMHRSDSENLRKRRTKRSSVSYESNTEINVNEYPRRNAYHRHIQKDDVRNVNLQKTDVGDKYIETDKTKTTVSTRTKDKEGRVKYSTGISSSHDEEYKGSNLKDQNSLESDYIDSKSEDQKRRVESEEHDTEWEDQKAKVRTEYKDSKLEHQKREYPEYKDGKSEDYKRGIIRPLNEDGQKRRIGSEYKHSRSEGQESRTGSRHTDSKSVNQERIGSEYEHRKDEDHKRRRESENEDNKWEDHKRKVESHYSKPDDYKRKIESEYEDDDNWEDQKRRLGPEYSKSDDHKRRIESGYEDSKWEDQKRKTGPEYSKLDGHKRRTEPEYEDSKSKDQKRRIRSDYKDSKSEDQKRRTGPEHRKDKNLEDQKRTQRRDREASSKKDENIDYGTEESMRFVRDEKDGDTEESRKGKTTKNYDDETDDDYIKKGNKKISTEKTPQGEKQSNNKLTQTTLTRADKKRDYSSSSTSSSSQTESSSSDSSQSYICPCCKKNKSKASALVSNLQRDIQPLLCQPCHTQNQQNNWSNSYRHPGHVCNCYTVLKTETVQQIKKTVDELGDLEREQQYCSCTFAGKNKNIKYCTYCDCKKKSGRKKDVAYMLTFEQGSNESDEEIRQRSSLEEVKVKIPHPHKKKNKDDENKKRKAKKDDSSHRRHRHQSHKKQKHPKTLTLQEYLSLNRPNFIENAEQRRKCMIELAYMREQRCEKYKQLLALSNGFPPPKNDVNDLKSKRAFSSKKMKEITAQNYKKLPEVQQKLKDNRDKQIKKANRLLADIFNKKLHENVLKGRHTLSTSTSVIKLI